MGKKTSLYTLEDGKKLLILTAMSSFPLGNQLTFKVLQVIQSHNF